MNNHVHLLINDANQHLSQAMQLLATRYASYFNWRWNRSGHVFQGRYGSDPIDDETYLLEAIRYIHNNPALARISPSDQYVWSSYPDHAEKRAIPFIACDVSFMRELFPSGESFEKFVAERSPIGYYYEGGRRLSDTQALVVARYVMGGRDPSSLKRMPREQRPPFVKALRRAGLSLRQIERITGLSRKCLDC